jgi:hypothetical protein
MNKPTRFDLEQQIMDCWSIIDDLQVVLAISQSEDIDRIQNSIIGLRELYGQRFEMLFDTFSECIKSGDIS